MKKLLFCILLLLAICLSAQAEEAADITGRCAFTVSQDKSNIGAMTDADYYSFWTGKKNAWVQIGAPDGEPLYGLYVCWGRITPWEAQAQDASGEWRTVYTSEDEFYHQYIPLPEGYSAVRLVNVSKDGYEMKVSELRALGAGEVPGWVQQWRNFEGKADLVLLITDPGDEYLFFGGLLPTYIAQGKEIMLCECINTIAAYKSQLLDGAWNLGLRNYPYMAYFKPRMSNTLQGQYENWSEVQFVRHVSRIVRMYKPDVLVTHSKNGEGIDGGHKVCADASIRSLTTAMDELYDVGYGYANWGNWKVKKLYLHLYGDSETVLDYHQPLDYYGGRTADEMAQEAYALQDYQRKSLKGRDLKWGEGICDGSAYGLVYSEVGEDTGAGDLFEHLD